MKCKKCNSSAISVDVRDKKLKLICRACKTVDIIEVNDVSHNVRCDCSHKYSDHDKTGKCTKCGCEWYHPYLEYLENNERIKK